MFTGIVEYVGSIASIERHKTGARLRVDAGPLAPLLAVAASIAVNGCCLTVVELTGSTFLADLSTETLACTSLGEIAAGTRVNLERPLAAGAPLGGHFMQGHVDAVGRVTRLEAEGPNWWLAVRLPAAVERYVAPKGSIAIDGISLTVAHLRDRVAEAAIIPFTYANTNLQSLRAGSAVNLEADILAKYVERLNEGRREAPASRWTVERLREEGF